VSAAVSIVLAGDNHGSVWAGLLRLDPVADALEELGIAFETIVVVYDDQPDIDELTRHTNGVTFVRPGRGDGSVLERWRAGAAAATGERLWLVGTGSALEVDALYGQLAVLQGSVGVAIGAGEALLRHRGDPLPGGPPADAGLTASLIAVATGAAAAGARVLNAPSHQPDAPFHTRGESLGYHIRRWHEATIIEGAPGAVVTGRHCYADVGTVFRQWGPHQIISVGHFTYLAADVLVSNPSDGVTPAERIGPLGLRPTFGHNQNLASIGLMWSHVPHLAALHAGATAPSPLTIGNDVWIGSRATLVGSMTVGDGAIVGAGAVVLGDVPPYAVVEGNPARVVRMRFSAPVVDSLLRIRWWDWDDARIARYGEWFTRPIQEFVNRFDPARRLGTAITEPATAGAR